MEAGDKNILIVKGKTMSESFRFIDFTVNPDIRFLNDEKIAEMIASGQAIPRDLTGCTFSAKAQRDGANSQTITFTCALDASDLTKSTVLMSYSKVQTASIGWDKGLWDLSITYPSTLTYLEIKGRVNVQKSVS